MKELVLKKIVLKDFKGQNISVEFNRKSTSIKGRNGKGKTTIQKAWNWLFTGWTDPFNVRNHELFDTTKEINENTPVASVKAWMDIDGYEYTLERTAEAKFVRKRASNEYEKASSDVYKIFIDNIETSNKDFNLWLERNICPVDLISFVLDGCFFTTLSLEDKTSARKILEGIVGEIKKEDFSGSYEELFNKLERYSVDELKEQVKNSLKPLNKRLKEIDTEIKAKNKSLLDFETENFDLIFAQIKGKKTEISELDRQILGASDAIKPLLEQRTKKLSEIAYKKDEIGECRVRYERVQKSKINEINDQILDIERTNKTIKSGNENIIRDFEKIKKTIASYKAELDSLNKQRDFLLEKRNKVMERVFTEDKCAYCGQELPYELLEKAKSKFNDEKQEELSIIVKQGKEVKIRIDNLTNFIKELEKKEEEGYSLKEELSKEDLVSRKSELESKFIPYEKTPEYAMLSGMVEEMEKLVPEIPKVDNEELILRKDKLMDELELLNRQYGRKFDLDRIKEEIETLINEQKEVAIEIAKLEGFGNMISEFESEKANIISTRVNKNLDDCEFQMWSTLKSGDRVEDCVLMSKQGVKYSTINNSNRMKMCIAIQKMFCEYIGMMLPVFVDEASEFDSFNKPVFDTQAIYLSASDDNNLVIE